MFNQKQKPLSVSAKTVNTQQSLSPSPEEMFSELSESEEYILRGGVINDDQGSRGPQHKAQSALPLNVITFWNLLIKASR
ncbi:MAG: hypothetical protein V7K48_25180 [Nostoc sp.]